MGDEGQETWGNGESAQRENVIVKAKSAHQDKQLFSPETQQRACLSHGGINTPRGWDKCGILNLSLFQILNSWKDRESQNKVQTDMGFIQRWIPWNPQLLNSFFFTPTVTRDSQPQLHSFPLSPRPNSPACTQLYSYSLPTATFRHTIRSFPFLFTHICYTSHYPPVFQIPHTTPTALGSVEKLIFELNLGCSRNLRWLGREALVAGDNGIRPFALYLVEAVRSD